jgi:UDP-N-acetylmuramoyl-L-alanyl-D-glutamate--2,6-diaminopimelate ligase
VSNDKKITVFEVAHTLGCELTGNGDATVSDITHDSRQARQGTLFVAIKGETADGHRFIDDVMRRGAVGVISENTMPEGFGGAWLKVADARRAHAMAASAVFDWPSSQLDLIGITGTNGKTTTTYLCFALAEAAGVKPAMLTTVEYRIGDESEPAIRTTPEASDTNRFLRRAVDSGCKMAVMEASSQAIHLRRCDQLQFRAAIFTNLTRDHLDYHGTMENYFDAKKELFDGRIGKTPEVSIVNIDDEWGVKLAEDLRLRGQRVVTFAQNRSADLTAENIDVSLAHGTSFLLKTPAGEIDITSPLVGKPHVYNMLAASAAAIELGHGLDTIARGLGKCVGAPGRFERVPNERGLAVIVDYAHTDDALLNTLQTARPLTKGKIITVFGCGGDRDRSKRIPMGKAAAENSDLAIITSDNPRNEDPMAIIREIEKGVQPVGTHYEVISDRREAIRRAVSVAGPDDVVIIAGKGHETYQIIGNEKFHFDDREIAAEAIAELAN